MHLQSAMPAMVATGGGGDDDLVTKAVLEAALRKKADVPRPHSPV